MAEVSYERTPPVVWRLGPDRVLVRSVGGQSLDLLGAAAMVWIVLEGSCTLSEMEGEIEGLTTDRPDLGAVLRDLLDRGLVRELT